MDMRYWWKKARVLVRGGHLRRLSPLMLLWRVVAAAGRSDCPLGVYEEDTCRIG